MNLRGVRLGLFMIAVLVLAAVSASWLSPYKISDADLPHELAGPSPAHWLGQDQDGVDVLTLLLYGARVSLLVSSVSVGIALIAGLGIGMSAGFFGGKFDAVCLWFMDVVLAFPGLVLAIAIAALRKEPGVGHVIIALSASAWIPFARLARTKVLQLKKQAYVEAAHSLGFSAPRILLRHLLPNLWGPILVQATFSIGAAIMAESTLSFLGLGVSLDTPSWGSMLDYGTQYLLIAPHLSIFPGLAMILAILSFQILGEGLRGRFNE